MQSVFVAPDDKTNVKLRLEPSPKAGAGSQRFEVVAAGAYSRDLVRGWESLTDGWHEMLSRSASALTQFTRKTPDVGGAYHVRQCAYGVFERA